MSPFPRGLNLVQKYREKWIYIGCRDWIMWFRNINYRIDIRRYRWKLGQSKRRPAGAEIITVSVQQKMPKIVLNADLERIFSADAGYQAPIPSTLPLAPSLALHGQARARAGGRGLRAPPLAELRRVTVLCAMTLAVSGGFSLLANLSQQEQEALQRSAAAVADLLPELGAADLAGMSLSPRHHPHQQHTTPFSVSDILSPVDEPQPQASPYRSSSSSSGAAGTGGVATHSPPPPVPPPPVPAYMQLSHHHQFAGAAQYCNGSDISAHYGNSGWYGAATAGDPRFASKYPNLTTALCLLDCSC